MSNVNGTVSEAAAGFGDKVSALAREATDWVSGNIVDIAIAAGAGILIALALLGLRALGMRLVARGATGAEPHWRLIFARVLAKTNLFFVVMIAAELVVEHADTPSAILRVVNILFVVAAALQAAIWGRELILGYVQHRAGVDDEHSTLASAIGIIRLLVTVALFAIAIIVILDNLGVNVTGLVAGLGIGGIAIGLAAQGIFSDLFAALSIIFDKPFRRGDTITFGSPPTTGTVERIGLKSTRIRALSGEEVVMSNANLLNAQVQNFALIERRRAVMTFGIVYQTPPETVAALPGELKAIVERQPLASFERAHATQFGPSSIDFELVFYAETADLAETMDVRQGVLVGIMRRLAELGIDFAYPTQTTFTAAPDGRLVMPYPHVKVLAEPEDDDRR